MIYDDPFSRFIVIKFCLHIVWVLRSKSQHSSLKNKFFSNRPKLTIRSRSSAGWSPMVKVWRFYFAEISQWTGSFSTPPCLDGPNIVKTQKYMLIIHSATRPVVMIEIQFLDCCELFSNNLTYLPSIGFTAENVKLILPCQRTTQKNLSIVIVWEASQFILSALWIYQ